MNKVLLTIVSATEMEIQPVIDYLDKNSVITDNQKFQLGDVSIDVLITGIGLLSTTYALMEYLNHNQPDKWIQAGIGGAFDRSLQIGNVYQIGSETLLDFGAQEKDGTIMSPFDLGWIQKNENPFTDGLLKCPFVSEDVGIPSVTGMTTLYAHGEEKKIMSISNQVHGQIESMEGAAFFYVSLMKKIPFMSFRAVSNYVEPRDKNSWRFSEAIDALAQVIISVVQRPSL